jgi:hypothetical protein
MVSKIIRNRAIRVGLAMAACVAVAGCPIAYCQSARDMTLVVDDRERVNSSSQSTYLVFTPDAEYEVADSITFFTFNSSSRYNQLDPGRSYKVRVAGWRVPFFSMYPNIIEVYGPEVE